MAVVIDNVEHDCQLTQDATGVDGVGAVCMYGQGDGPSGLLSWSASGGGGKLDGRRRETGTAVEGQHKGGPAGEGSGDLAGNVNVRPEASVECVRKRGGTAACVPKGT